MRKWYSSTREKVLEELKVDEKGLSSEEVEERLQNQGLNKLPEKEREHILFRFLKNFHNILIYILLVAAVVTALMGHWLDTWVILAVVVINAVIEFVQEEKAEKALESIQHMLAPETMVRREGKRKEIPAKELVPGDIVLLSSGDKVPADLRLLETGDFKVEEAALTGEADAVNKNTELVEEGTPLGDRRCMAYSGTQVRYGNATGVVVATGQDTELGKIDTMIEQAEEITTPLIKKINEFGRYLAGFIVGMGLLFFAFGYFIQGLAPGELMLTVIGLAVASIPEGLPAILTITLALGVQRMARRNAVIRKLPSVETLGSCTVICSDKTGTLTHNEMTVERIYTVDDEYGVDGAGYTPEGSIKAAGKEVTLAEKPELEKMLYSHFFCNNTELQQENGNWEIKGSPTEGAMKSLACKTDVKNVEGTRLDIVPFASEYKFMAVLVEVKGDRFIFMNGAPDRLLAMCDKQQESGKVESIKHDLWQDKIETGAEQGQRMLGSAFKQVEDSKESLTRDDLEEGMIFLGLVGMVDPPRQEAIEAIEECSEAGIEVKMITGDHATTAAAIGREVGISQTEDVITGRELEQMDDEEFRSAVREYDIFARTSPEHKLRLVKALQQNDEVCAMTGDGVNDAPALKQADVGIAMGIKGTEVTKDAASMVLLDDNFASIVNAVEEGRTIYDNIRKTLYFLLPTNGAEALVLIIGLLLGMTQVITPVQILWVNMVTAVTLALALSFEPMEENTMKIPPRDTDEPILGRYFVIRIIFVSLLIGGFTFANFWFFRGRGFNIEAVRTIAINTLVFCQLFYLFNCRKIHELIFGKTILGNKMAFLVSGVLIILQLLFTYLPWLNTLFGTEPVKLSYWLGPLVSGFLVFLLVEAEKKFLDEEVLS